jgi:hypothetical protein
MAMVGTSGDGHSSSAVRELVDSKATKTVDVTLADCEVIDLLQVKHNNAH